MLLNATAWKAQARNGIISCYVKGFSSPELHSLRSLLFFMLLALMICLQSKGAALAQSVTIKVNNARLQQVFKSIEQQSDYRFIYTDEQLASTKPVTLEVENIPVAEVLTICFRDQPIGWVLKGNTVVVQARKEEKISSAIVPGSGILSTPVGDTSATLVDVEGKVTDEQGRPIDGVTVSVKGSTRATLTDVTGFFMLKEISTNAVLVFSSVNTQSYEIAINGRTKLPVTLSNKIKQMEEVTVNTGYQKVNATTTPGSFTKIDNTLFNRQPGTSVLDRMRFITPGLYSDPSYSPGTSQYMLIRGLSTINGNQRPLIVVDNFPYDESASFTNLINNINPSDVESITVLKDAAAASIWGARAGNGVIVITTKKGKYGQKMQVNFNSNVTIGQKPDLFYLPTTSSGDMVDFEKAAFDRGYYNASISDRRNYPLLSPAVEILVKRRNGEISPGDADAQLEALKKYDVRNDIDKYLQRKSLVQQYALNMSGGSPNYSYYASVGMNNNQASQVRNRNSQFTASFNNTYKPISKIEINAFLAYVNTTAFNNGSVNTGNSPYLRLADDQGRPLSIPFNYRSLYIDTAKFPALLDWHYVPLDELKRNDNTAKTTDIRINTGINYAIIKGLSVGVQYGFQRTFNTGRVYYSPESYFARNLINQYMSISRNDGSIYYPVPNGAILDNSSSEVKSWNVRGQLNYNHQWGEHSLVAMAGAEAREVTAANSAFRLYGYDASTGTNTLQINYDSLFRLKPSNRTTARVPSVGSQAVNAALTRYVSYFANAAYTFRDKYTISASARADGSNFYGIKANQRIVPLWSTGLLWQVNKEDFYQEWLSWLPTLRARLSYGYSGNTNNAANGYALISYASNSSLTGLPYANVQSPPNPDLRWEKIKMFNLGIDWSGRNGRFSGSVEFYNKHSVDLIIDVPVYDYTTGWTVITTNAASMKGYGIDISLNSINLQTKQFRWDSRLTVGFNKEKITSISDNNIAKNGTAYVGGGLVVGKPLAGIYSYKWAGLNPINGDPRIYLSDTISSYTNYTNAKISDVAYNGPARPTVYGSLINTLNWQSFSLSCNVIYAFGGYFRRPSISYSDMYGGLRAHSDYRLRWQKAGDENWTNVPSTPTSVIADRDNVYRNSNILVAKSDNIRLNDIRLSYELLKSRLSFLPFRAGSLFLYAGNLNIIIWRANNNKIDPYFATAAPAPKALSIGLNVGF